MPADQELGCQPGTLAWKARLCSSASFPLLCDLINGLHPEKEISFKALTKPDNIARAVITVEQVVREAAPEVVHPCEMRSPDVRVCRGWDGNQKAGEHANERAMERTLYYAKKAYQNKKAKTENA